MVGVRGVYEVAIRVRDLKKAQAFYCDVLGLEVAVVDEKRPMVFLRAGGAAGMVVLQEDQGAWPSQHFALTIAEGDLEAAARTLRQHGVSVRGPVFHEWMPAKSLYFGDPDGHQMELCAPL